MQSHARARIGGGAPDDEASRDPTVTPPPKGRIWSPRFKAPWRVLAPLVVALAAAGSLVSSALAQASPSSGPAAGQSCDNRILRGDYGFSFSGSFSGGIPFTGVGSESCDENGHCTGVATLNIDGTTSTAPFTADYTINADCTGVETGNYYTIGLTVQEAVTIVDGGREVHFMGTDPGGTSIGVMKRR